MQLPRRLFAREWALFMAVWHFQTRPKSIFMGEPHEYGLDRAACRHGLFTREADCKERGGLIRPISRLFQEFRRHLRSTS